MTPLFLLATFVVFFILVAGPLIGVFFGGVLGAKGEPFKTRLARGYADVAFTVRVGVSEFLSASKRLVKLLTGVVVNTFWSLMWVLWIVTGLALSLVAIPLYILLGPAIGLVCLLSGKAESEIYYLAKRTPLGKRINELVAPYA